MLRETKLFQKEYQLHYVVYDKKESLYQNVASINLSLFLFFSLSIFLSHILFLQFTQFIANFKIDRNPDFPITVQCLLFAVTASVKKTGTNCP